MKSPSKFALCLTSILIASTPANAAVIINFGGTTPISGLNDFQPELNGLGLTQVATIGSSIILTEDSTITFDLLGTESGFDDTFSAGSILFTEFTTFLNSFASPTALGSTSFSAGDLAGLLTFTSSGGAPATIGSGGFGIFLGPTATSGDPFSVFYIGYDDQITNQDDDFDDLIVRATVTTVSAIPEATTWAMVLAGFGIAGFAVRRKRRPRLIQIA